MDSILDGWEAMLKDTESRRRKQTLMNEVRPMLLMFGAATEKDRAWTCEILISLNKIADLIPAVQKQPDSIPLSVAGAVYKALALLKSDESEKFLRAQSARFQDAVRKLILDDNLTAEAFKANAGNEDLVCRLCLLLETKGESGEILALSVLAALYSRIAYLPSAVWAKYGIDVQQKCSPVPIRASEFETPRPKQLVSGDFKNKLQEAVSA